MIVAFRIQKWNSNSVKVALIVFLKLNMFLILNITAKMWSISITVFFFLHHPNVGHTLFMLLITTSSVLLLRLFECIKEEICFFLSRHLGRLGSKACTFNEPWRRWRWWRGWAWTENRRRLWQGDGRRWNKQGW